MFCYQSHSFKESFLFSSSESNEILEVSIQGPWASAYNLLSMIANAYECLEISHASLYKEY